MYARTTVGPIGLLGLYQLGPTVSAIKQTLTFSQIMVIRILHHLRHF